MATRPKPWPHNAQFARDGAAESVQAAVRHLTPLLNSRDDLVLARCGLALASLQLALRHLEAVGASTRPTRD
jgi:hypothetical protein